MKTRLLKESCNTFENGPEIQDSSMDWNDAWNWI